MDSVPTSFGINDPWRKALQLVGYAVSGKLVEFIQQGKSINWLALLMRDQGYALGILNQGREIPERKRMQRSDFEAAKNAFLSRVQAMGLNAILNRA